MSGEGPPQAAPAPLYARFVFIPFALRWSRRDVGSELLRVPAQPVPPSSLQLVPEHVGVQVLAFVAKPEQLPERTSHVARRGYDKRYFS